MRNIVLEQPAQRCIQTQQRLEKANSEDFNPRRPGRFFFEIRIMADVVSLLMLRSKFKACSFTTLCARGKSFALL
jgi:hypothetical protein